MSADESIKTFWENVFSQSGSYQAADPLPYPLIEEGLAWLAQGSPRLLDFGSGTGRLLLRCLTLGAASGLGIDLSQVGVETGTRMAAQAGLAGQVAFTQGGIERLAELQSASFGGALLSNILDNLMPHDAERVIAEMHRLLVPGGRLLVKLNSCREPSVLDESGGYIKLGADVYQEPSGLILWNISEARLDQLIRPAFTLHRRVDIHFPEYNQWNRMYYLIHE